MNFATMFLFRLLYVLCECALSKFSMSNLEKAIRPENVFGVVCEINANFRYAYPPLVQCFKTTMLSKAYYSLRLVFFCRE